MAFRYKPPLYSAQQTLTDVNERKLPFLAAMYNLRLTQNSAGRNQYRVGLALDSDGLLRRTATVNFNFEIAPQDQEDLRWYLEDFLQYPFDPAPKIAARVEERMVEIGSNLFNALFQSSDEARDLWATLRAHLNDTRIEIVTEVHEAASVPWELVHDPADDKPLVLCARAFVRANPQLSQRPFFPEDSAAPMRILLVICRPGGDDDVPFRSVAMRIIKGLSERERGAFQLDVLRPPTLEQLSKVLRRAAATGQPYQAVHFDGHGIYEDLVATTSNLPHKNRRGYLIFENPTYHGNVELVHGALLGKILLETGVSLLVVNACRSAHADPPPAPDEARGTEAPYVNARAIGSLAHEVIESGVAGVVAMRYNVYVVAAAQFVADLYAALARGQTLGEAVTAGRKQLHDQPLREISYEPRPLQDWIVPVVYEAAPLALLPKLQQKTQFSINLSAGKSTDSDADSRLPKQPDAGFWGRDETLLALDRLFDMKSVVLLQGYAGSGKTTTVVEFARWYAATGGVEGQILFNAFEHYMPLARVLEQIGQVFGNALEQAGINWLALDGARRREVALRVLDQIPVLWIWDNVEPVSGFPAGTASAWGGVEQKELADFLRAAGQTKAKFLLTSRRRERAWLGELPARLTLPPMPMQERVQFARALAEHQGHRLTDVEDWRPLLQFTRGNPLTIKALVGQALRDNLRTREQIEDFVDQLHDGEAAFGDEASEGRLNSLGASLNYGFEHAFSGEERKQLALLHLFQSMASVHALCWMGNPASSACLAEVRGLTKEAATSLLDRAAEIGLLESRGGGYYYIHPALPWFFKNLFDQYYLAPYSFEGGRERVARAYVEWFSHQANHLHDEYGAGETKVSIAILSAEEANILHARQLAFKYGWWTEAMATMQGLDVLYNNTGRWAEWARLIQEIMPHLLDPKTEEPLPGREELWGLIMRQRVTLAERDREWAEAERLLRLDVDWARRRAATALASQSVKLSKEESNDLRSLGAGLFELGKIQRELGQPECVASLQESLQIMDRIGDRAGASSCALGLGHAYLTIPALKNLDRAEDWYRHGLSLADERGLSGQAGFLGQLGHVAHERFKEARAAKRPKEELILHLNTASQILLRAAQLLPPDAVSGLSVTYQKLGGIYYDAGDTERTVRYYQEAIRYAEMVSDHYVAAASRFNIALALAEDGRLADARDYAYAASRAYGMYGQRAAVKVHETQQLIEEIERLMRGQKG